MGFELFAVESLPIHKKLLEVVMAFAIIIVAVASCGLHFLASWHPLKEQQSS